MSDSDTEQPSDETKIRRVARRAGVLRIEQSAYPEAKQIAKNFLQEILSDPMLKDKNQISAEDVVKVLREKKNRIVYGVI